MPPPLPPPPECIPHPPMLPFPVEEVYVLPLYSCVEALTESAPQARCKSLKGSSCLRLAGFPDLYPRKLCSIAPVRHISIDIKPAAPSFQRVIRPQLGTPTPGPYPNVSSRHCCKEPLRTCNSQPPLRTPPSVGQARPAFQQPEPLLEIIRQSAYCPWSARQSGAFGRRFAMFELGQRHEKSMPARSLLIHRHDTAVGTFDRREDYCGSRSAACLSNAGT